MTIRRDEPQVSLYVDRQLPSYWIVRDRAGDFWVVDETPQVSGVIVILSDDNYEAARATRAAQLFRAGMAPRILASGRLLRTYAGIAELMEHDLKAQGVPANAIVPLPHRGTNTSPCRHPA